MNTKKNIRKKILIFILGIAAVLFYINMDTVKIDCQLELTHKIKYMQTTSHFETIMSQPETTTLYFATHFGHTIYTCDEHNNIIKEEFYDNEDILYEYHICAYDERDNLIKDEEYNGDNSLIECHIYTNDERGNTIEDKVYDNNGSLSEFHIYTYGKHNYPIKGDHYYKDGIVIIDLY